MAEAGASITAGKLASNASSRLAMSSARVVARGETDGVPHFPFGVVLGSAGPFHAL